MEANSCTLGSGAGLRLELVRSEDAGQPFVVLHEGRYSRIYLAALTVAGRRTEHFALKVQTDGYEPFAPAQGRLATNADIDELWQREIADLERSSSPHVIARLPGPPVDGVSPPVIYCKATDRYFHPPCPETGALLRVCKDDDRLADAGLVEYSKDTWRYLHNGKGPDAAGGRIFYRTRGVNGERPREGVKVRTGSELFRDWAALVHREQAPGPDAAAAGFPCLSCDRRASCYPASAAGGERRERIPAEDQLHAVSYYDFRALPLPLLDVDYAQLTALLGGASIDEAFAADSSAGSRARQRLLGERTGAGRDGSPRGDWLFAGDARRVPLEILRLKLAAFLEVCDGLGAVHAGAGRAHLGISPPNVMARLEPGSRTVPMRWNFRVRLIDLGSPQRRVRAGGDAPPLFDPGIEMREDLRARPFVAPDLLAQERQSCAMTVQLRRTGEASGRVKVAVAAQGQVKVKHCVPGDVVCIAPAGAAADGDAALWARLDELRAREVLASAEVAASHPCLQWIGRAVDATVTFHRDYGPPVDLFGLGMLLFRTLLVNDQQGMDEVAEAVAKCRRRLEDELPQGAVDPRQATARVQHALAQKDVRERFGAANLLQRAEDRAAFAEGAPDRREPVDARLWQSLLLVAFKLTTRFRGFSYCDSHAASSPFFLRSVRDDVQALARRVHVELFAADERDDAIAKACTTMLGRLREQMLAAAPGQGATGTGGGTLAGATMVLNAAALAAPPSRGFRLLVSKEGDAAKPQEYSFDREQVTIGRREVDNLVRLNDAMVSSAHAVIELQDGEYVLIDRNSKNGTEVDGIRLPVDVPQPLADGAVIHIRPFKLVFAAGSAAASAAAATAMVTLDQIVEMLHAEYARLAEAQPSERAAGLTSLLEKLVPSVGVSTLHGMLEDVARTCRRGAASDDAAAAGERVAAQFFTGAFKALSRLSANLVGPAEFRSLEQVDRFAARLEQFIELTVEWIENNLVLRRELNREFELGTTNVGMAAGSVRTAQDIKQLTLAWTDGAALPEGASAFLRKFYSDIQAQQKGLLSGAKEMLRAVRERLDPERLVALAGREAKLRILVNAAAGSALWKLYVQAFQDVTESKQFELELDRLLQQSLQQYRSAARSERG